MGSAGPNASVEEILASIRQAISDDDARRSFTHRRQEPRSLAEPARRPVVGRAAQPAAAPEEEAEPVAETPPEDAAEDEASGADSYEQGVIEHAIEQALNGVRAELEGKRQPVSRLKPRQELVKATPRTIPRANRPVMTRREPPGSRALLSPRTDAQVSASFDDLAKAMIEGNAGQLETVVEDLLRPMLKDWLEANLPQMVERMVREEIERVARGRR